jgi:hypothetical protein
MWCAEKGEVKEYVDCGLGRIDGRKEGEGKLRVVIVRLSSVVK